MVRKKMAPVVHLVACGKHLVINGVMLSVREKKKKKGKAHHLFYWHFLDPPTSPILILNSSKGEDDSASGKDCLTDCGGGVKDKVVN